MHLNLSIFQTSGINNYNNFKENELEIRKKELELFKEIKRKKDIEEDLEEARVRALKKKNKRKREERRMYFSDYFY